MINDLDLAVAITERFNESEVIVTRKVFLQVIDRLVEQGYGQAALNVRQFNANYPYMHRVNWRGVAFVHFSSDVLSGASEDKLSLF